MTDFVCAVDERHRSACEDLPNYSGTIYCVLHHSSEEKKEDFLEVITSKLDRKDYDFGGTVFSEGTSDFEGFDFDADANFEGVTFVGRANFSEAKFSGERTSFSQARFSGERTSFYGAQFSRGVTTFSYAQFSSELTNFSGAQFRAEQTSFREAQFSGKSTDFSEAQFSSDLTYFSQARFSTLNTDFSGAQFRGGLTDFTGARFSSDKGTDFSEAQFGGEWTYFLQAEFGGEWTSFQFAEFGGKRTDFSDAQFNGQTDFHDTTLRNATFKSTTFHRRVDFTRAKFEGKGKPTTDFREATFRGELYFKEAEFKGYTDFYRTNFLDAVKFIGGPPAGDSVFDPNGHVSFIRARIEKPELFSFDTLLLRPSWFVGVDVRRFQFNYVAWFGLSRGATGTLEDDVQRLQEQGLTAPHRVLAKTCENLALMAENNGDYDVAGEFYYHSMDIRRKENWRTIGLTGYFYWALSGYGEKPSRAFSVLVAICLVFAALYTVVGPSPLQIWNTSGLFASVQHALQALAYSLGVLSRIGPKPEPHPGLFQLLVTFESIVGPVQIAVLLLAIRRKILRERIFQ